MIHSIQRSKVKTVQLYYQLTSHNNFKHRNKQSQSQKKIEDLVALMSSQLVNSIVNMAAVFVSLLLQTCEGS